MNNEDLEHIYPYIKGNIEYAFKNKKWFSGYMIVGAVPINRAYTNVATLLINRLRVIS